MIKLLAHDLPKNLPTTCLLQNCTDGDIPPLMGGDNTPFGQVNGQGRLSPNAYAGLKRESQKSASLEKLFAAVAETWNVTPIALTTRTRKLYEAEARFVCMWFMRKHYKMTFDEIGVYFGIDHSTVIHGVGQVKNRLEVYNDFQVKFNNVKILFEIC